MPAMEIEFSKIAYYTILNHKVDSALEKIGFIYLPYNLFHFALIT